MDRRALLAGLAGALGLASRSDPVRAADDRPDIIVLLTDDMNDDDLRVMTKTRQLIAKTEFPNFVYPTPLCGPNRATLLTGQYAHNHGVRTNGETWSRIKRRGRRTLYAAMFDAGYHVGWVGKFLNGYENGPVTGIDDIRSHDLNGDSYNTGHGYRTEIEGGKAVDLIQQTPAEKPLFLTAGFRAPHDPWQVARRYDRADVGPTKNGADAKRKRMLLSVDDAIANIHAAQLERGRPACWFFLSDNGYLVGEHGGLYGKGTWWKEASVVTMWADCAGLAPGVDPRLAATIDLAPTILTVAGVDLSEGALGWALDGRALQDTWTRTMVGVENSDLSGDDDAGLKLANVRYRGIRGLDFLYVEKAGKPKLYLNGEESRTAPLKDSDKQTFKNRLQAMMNCRGDACRNADQGEFPTR